MVGVTTAFYLQADGHDVTVIERNKSSGLETSFANAGQLCHFTAKPWASPSVPSGPPYAAHHIVPPRHKAWTPPEAEGNRWWKLSVYTVFHAVCTTIVIQLYPCTFTCDQSSK